MICKAPNESFSYVIDWADALGADTISSSEWTIETGVVKDTDSVPVGETTTKIDLSGGTAGTTYQLINKITTIGGDIFERHIYIVVQNRLTG